MTENRFFWGHPWSWATTDAPTFLWTVCLKFLVTWLQVATVILRRAEVQRARQDSHKSIFKLFKVHLKTKHSSVMKTRVPLLRVGTSCMHVYPATGATSQQSVQQLLQLRFQVQLLAQRRQVIPVQEPRGGWVAAIKLCPQLRDVLAVVIVLHHHEAWRYITCRCSAESDITSKRTHVSLTHHKPTANI